MCLQFSVYCKPEISRKKMPPEIFWKIRLDPEQGQYLENQDPPEIFLRKDSHGGLTPPFRGR